MTTTDLPRAPRIPLAHRVRRRRRVYQILNRVERERLGRRTGLAASDQRMVRIRGHLRVVDWKLVDRPGDVADENRRLVVDLCAAADIPCFEIPSSSGRHRVGIAEQDWLRLLQAIAADADLSTYLSTVGVDRRSRRILITRPPSAAVSSALAQRVVRVGRWIADPRSRRVLGPELACELERWDAELDGTCTAPRPNASTARIRLDQLADPSQGTVALRPLPVPAAAGVFDVNFPIDLVVLWVDGSDPAWLSRKADALGEALGTEHALSVADSRYRDNGELRYLLRSVHRHLPWMRRLHLVTDDQVPSWLDESHPQLQVVSHRQLFDGTGVQHSFNSHAIAARLAHVPGVSEQFLYTNDDIFFGRPVAPQTFFLSNGMVKIYPSRSTLPAAGAGSGLPHEEARRNSADMVQEMHGRRPTQNFQHIPLAMRRSLLLELEALFPDHFLATWTSPFRSTADLEIGWLHHYAAYLSGRAVTGTLRYDYFQISSSAAWRRMRRQLARRDLDVFCINDDDELEEHLRAQRIGNWLERYFPEPSPWEQDIG